MPRPETETVVERCIELLRDVQAPRVLDVGTGTGAIALALADEVPGARVVAIDSSAEALSLARENATLTGLARRAPAARSERRAAARPVRPRRLEPAVRPRRGARTLEPEVRDWEPREALLDSGQTEAIARNGRDVLAPGGVLVLEIHEQRAAEARVVLENLGYRVRIKVDLTGRDRIVEGKQA